MPKPNDKPYALLLSPVMPAKTGSGRAMRAWDWVSELQSSYRLGLIVVSEAEPIPPEVAQLVEQLFFLPPLAGGTQRIFKLAGLVCPWLSLLNHNFFVDWPRIDPQSNDFLSCINYFADKDIELLLVFRLYLHQIGQYLQQELSIQRTELDCDDVESSTRHSLYQAAMTLQYLRQGWQERLQGLAYRLNEKRLLRTYSKAYVACIEDVTVLSGIELTPRPNRISLFTPLQPSRARGSCFTLVFCGTLNYLPNIEAIEHLLLPLSELLAKRWHRPWQMIIAGNHPSKALAEKISHTAHTRLWANPSQMSAVYQQASVALVPIKFGGGTKLKTIEAFAYKIPVVSTSHGVRGLSVTAGKTCCLAEQLSEFIDAITELAEHPERAQQMTQTAYAYYLSDLTYETPQHGNP